MHPLTAPGGLRELDKWAHPVLLPFPPRTFSTVFLRRLSQTESKVRVPVSTHDSLLCGSFSVSKQHLPSAGRARSVVSILCLAEAIPADPIGSLLSFSAVSGTGYPGSEGNTEATDSFREGDKAPFTYPAPTGKTGESTTQMSGTLHWSPWASLDIHMPHILYAQCFYTVILKICRLPENLNKLCN